MGSGSVKLTHYRAVTWSNLAERGKPASRPASRACGYLRDRYFRYLSSQVSGNESPQRVDELL